MCPTPYGSLGCDVHDLMVVLEVHHGDAAPWGCIILLRDRRVQPASPDEGEGWEGTRTIHGIRGEMGLNIKKNFFLAARSAKLR